MAPTEKAPTTSGGLKKRAAMREKFGGAAGEELDQLHNLIGILRCIGKLSNGPNPYAVKFTSGL